MAEVVGVIGADEGREGYLVVGDFGGESESDCLGSFPGRGDHFSFKAFCFGAVLESDVDFLGAQFFRNGVTDDEGDLFAWGGGFGGDEGDEFLVALVLRLFVFSACGATGSGFLLFFLGVKMADFGIVAFLECFEGVVSSVGHFGE